MKKRILLRCVALLLIASAATMIPSHKVAAEGNGTEGKTLYEHIADEAVADNVASEYVASNTGIDFSQPTVDAEGNYVNGNGIYQLSSTVNDENPVYYYRGDPGNNNVLFNGFCWLAMHTTETGGVKLIYNGLPGSNGSCPSDEDDGISYGCSGSYGTLQTIYCNDTPAPETAIALSSFNSAAARGAGYVYDDIQYGILSKPTQIMHLNPFPSDDGTEPEPEVYIFGRDVEFVDGNYMLLDTASYDENASKDEIQSIVTEHRYTCRQTGVSTCSTVYYALAMPTWEYMDAVILENGVTIDDLIAQPVTAQDSVVKGVVEDWFSENMTSAQDVLEDSPVCNERNMLANNLPNSLQASTNIASAAASIVNQPNLIASTRDGITQCGDQREQLSVSNGDLRYPIALPSVSELLLAGVTIDTSDVAKISSFLDDGEVYWTMDQSKIADYFYGSNQYNVVSTAFYVNYKGAINSGVWTTTRAAVRPVISFKNSIGFTDGDGTHANPFTGAYEPPRIIDGANQTFDADEGNPIVVRASSNPTKLLNLQVDGQTVTPDNYTVSSEDTIVTLSNEYMDTLSDGEHTVTYQFLDGADQTYEITKDGSPITLRADGDIAKFVRLLVDGEEVDPENYELAAGSTIVTLSPAYLSTLADGAHVITFVYADGEASTGLTVTRAASVLSNPDTVDILVIVAIVLAVAAAVFTGIGRRAATRRR